MTKDELTVQEAAEILGYHVNHVYRLLYQGKLKGEKVLDRVWVLKRDDVLELKSQQLDSGRLPG